MSRHRTSTFTRRALIFGGAKVAAVSLLLGRLYYLQFIRASEFKTLAEDNRVKLQLIPPERGFILDRHGEELAINQKNFRLLIEVTHVGEMEKTLLEAGKYVELSKAKIDQVLHEARRVRVSPPLLVREHLDWEEVVKLEFHAPDLPGITIDNGLVRHYPLMEKSAHLLGYVGLVSEEDLDGQPLLRLPGFRIGKNGVEKSLEDQLRGTAGVKHLEVNVHGLPVRELSTRPAIAGENVKLSIDRRIQDFAAERLAGESGAVVVMDLTNGEVLALVSVPGYDPDHFSMGIKPDYWKKLHDDKKHPLINKAIAGIYPPGSTFKMVTGLAGLEAGVITPHSSVFCPGHFFLGSHRFNCWKPEGHGTMDLRSAIAHSCDTYFYTVAQRAGIEPIASMARRLGLGAPTGIRLPGEKGALVPDKNWKRKRYNQPWQGGDTVNVGIGQGYILATPMQLAVMTARLASGKEVTPRLLPATETEEAAVLKIDPEHLAVVREGMNWVVNTPGGTAYGKRIADPRFAMAGKTGTSQVRKITVRGRDQASLPWEYRHHALFVCFAPLEKPRFACSVLVEHGGGGSAAAAPVARDIMLFTQQLFAGEIPSLPQATPPPDASTPEPPELPEEELPADAEPAEEEEHDSSQ